MPTSTMQLFLSMIRNARSCEMNRAMIGHSLDQRLPRVTRDAIAEFTHATRDDNPVYDCALSPAPLFFTAGLFIPLIKDIWAHPSLKLNLLKTVQISQSVTWHAPIRERDEISIQLRIEDICSSIRGEILKLSGTALIEGRVAVQGAVEFLVKSRRDTRTHKAGEEKPVTEAFRLVIPTAEGQQLLYAKATGDNNFIHTSSFLARIAGLPRTVMHGACTLAMICNALTKQLVGNDITRPASVSGRFGRPVIPGEALTVIGYESEDQKTVPFSVVNSEEKAILREGVFSIKV